MARIARPWNELTEEQKANRLRNEKYKNRKSNVVKLNSSKEKIVVKKESKNNWHILLSSLMTPSSVFLILGVASLSTYLVFQFASTGDMWTGIVVELMAVLFAALMSTSKDKMSLWVSRICLLSVICFSSLVLHEGLNKKSNQNDFGINSLKENRQTLIDQMDQLNKDISSLPDTYVSKKMQLRSALPDLNEKIENLTYQISSASSIGVYSLSSLVIRILCMMANLLMVHRLMTGVKESHDR